MPGSLSNSVSYLAEEINKNKDKDCIDNCLECLEKNRDTKYKDCKFFIF